MDFWLDTPDDGLTYGKGYRRREAMSRFFAAVPLTDERMLDAWSQVPGMKPAGIDGTIALLPDSAGVTAHDSDPYDVIQEGMPLRVFYGQKTVTN